VPPALAGDIGFLLARASGVALRAANVALQPQRLRARQLTVLRLVGAGPLSQREISEVLGLDPSNVVSLLDDLEEQGLIRRAVSRHDRRTRLVSLTRRGHARMIAGGQLADQAIAGVVAALPADRQRELVAMLAAIVSGDQSRPDP
jgi:DNA-binding MarR family transcriptional regulator